VPQATTRSKGDAAELAVLAKLTALGYAAKLTGTYHSPHDIDIETDGKPILIQVKSAWFNKQRGTWRSQCKRTWRDRDRGFHQDFYQPGDFDFYIAWIEPTNTFYVLPFSEIEGKHALTFMEGKVSQRGASTEKFREAWPLISDLLYGWQLAA